MTRHLDPNALFCEVLSAAISELSETGFISEERLMDWVVLLRNAAEREVGPDYAIDEEIRQGFTRLYERFVNGTGLEKRIDVPRFTKEMVKPKLRGELDRRIVAAADLIKLNKREAVERTLKRFSGWATSIPPGGYDDVDIRETSAAIAKDLKDYRYHKRLVDNDQGHKLISNIASLTAEAAGAVAGVWHSHGASDHSYNARKEHLSREGKIYIVRGSWAHEKGFIKPIHGFTDEITAPGQEVNCRCWLTYITSPRKLPDAFLTRKGQEWIAGRLAA